jgi:hypothetical protein
MSGRVIICGSRDFSPLTLVDEYVDKLDESATVIVGDARGPDKRAENRARERGLQVEVFEADWETYGKAAGFRRNKEMLDANPTHVVAFWDGHSHGTKLMIEETSFRGKMAIEESRKQVMLEIVYETGDHEVSAWI